MLRITSGVALQIETAPTTSLTLPDGAVKECAAGPPDPALRPLVMIEAKDESEAMTTAFLEQR